MKFNKSVGLCLLFLVAVSCSENEGELTQLQEIREFTSIQTKLLNDPDMLEFTISINTILSESNINIKNLEEYDLRQDEDLSILPQIMGISEARLRELQTSLFRHGKLLTDRYGSEQLNDKSLMSEVIKEITLQNDLALASSYKLKCNSCFGEAIAEYAVDTMTGLVMSAVCTVCGIVKWGWGTWKLIKAQNNCGCIY